MPWKMMNFQQNIETWVGVKEYRIWKTAIRERIFDGQTLNHHDGFFSEKKKNENPE